MRRNNRKTRNVPTFYSQFNACKFQAKYFFKDSVQTLVHNSILLTGLELNCTMWDFHLSVELTPYSIFFENCMQQFVLLMCWR